MSDWWLLCSCLGLLILITGGVLFASRLGTINKGASAAQKKGGSSCPLCGSMLASGEQIHSRVYGNMQEVNSQGLRCLIMGCPHCFPRPAQGLSRLCPVCGRTVGENGGLTARFFVREGGKRHVHVTGCTHCSSGFRS